MNLEFHKFRIFQMIKDFFFFQKIITHKILLQIEPSKMSSKSLLNVKNRKELNVISLKQKKNMKKKILHKISQNLKCKTHKLINTHTNKTLCFNFFLAKNHNNNKKKLLFSLLNNFFVINKRQIKLFKF